MRIFTASLATETNTFSPVPTDRASFEMAFYAAPGKHPDTPTLCSSPMVALRRRAKADGLTVIEGTATWAEPGGLVQRQAYEGAARRNPRAAVGGTAGRRGDPRPARRHGGARL